MPIPKSIIKYSKNGVSYESSVDRVNYTIKELTRAALRDCGKFICKKFKVSFYAAHKKRKGNVGKYTQYWVKHRQDEIELQVGLKPNAFYGGFQEFGSSKVRKEALLMNAAQENVAEIVKIQSKYLSSLEDEAKSLALISEKEYAGGADD